LVPPIAPLLTWWQDISSALLRTLDCKFLCVRLSRSHHDMLFAPVLRRCRECGRGRGSRYGWRRGYSFFRDFVAEVHALRLHDFESIVASGAFLYTQRRSSASYQEHQDLRCICVCRKTDEWVLSFGPSVLPERYAEAAMEGELHAAARTSTKLQGATRHISHVFASIGRSCLVACNTCYGSFHTLAIISRSSQKHSLRGQRCHRDLPFSSTRPQILQCGTAIQRRS